MPETYIPATDIASDLIATCFGIAFLLMLMGAGVTYLRRKKCVVSQAMEDSAPIAPTPPPLPPSGKVATWWCHRIDVLGLLLFGMVFSFFAQSQVTADQADAKITMSPSLLVMNIVVFAFLVAVATILVFWRVRPVTWLGLRWQQWPHFFWIGPAAVMVMWVVLGVLQTSGYIAWMEKLVGSPSTQEAVKLLRESKDWLIVGLMAFSAAIVAPIAEEVIFRGYLYPVTKHFAGRWIGMVATSLLFAAGHGNVPLLLPLFLLGILMALAYEWTGSLWAAISIHFFFNTTTVALQLALRADWITLPETLP